MKSTIKLLSFLIAFVMLLTSCGMLGDMGENGSSETKATSAAKTEEATTEALTEEITTEADTEETTEDIDEETTEAPIPYRSSISRTREEVEAMLTITDEAYTTAQTLLDEFKKLAIESDDIEKIEETSLAFEDAYYYVSTQLSIANIIYNIDMSDEEAHSTYMTIYEKYGDLYDSYIEIMKHVYENAPLRDQIFEDWTEKDIRDLYSYTPEIIDLQLKNEDLTNQVNNLGDHEFTDKSAELYVQIVANNNKIAEILGYDNYYDYASADIYSRDYGREELEKFCNNIAINVMPRYEFLAEKVSAKLGSLSDKDMDFLYNYLYSPFDRLDKNYLTSYISSLDGSMKEGMEHIFVNRNMIFSNNRNSHPSAFQVYLDALEMPFCLFGTDGQSTDSLVHEIGHYYASLHSEIDSYDLAEVQSQANELLLLDYLKEEVPSSAYSALKSYCMYMDITEIIISVLVDEFEREVYALESVEGYGSAEFDAIMAKVCEKYGGIEFVEETITDINYYWRMVATNNPVYYISYAVSNTAALNIFSITTADRAAGREAYRQIVEEIGEDDTFVTALHKAGLSSPFENESIEELIYAVFGKRVEISDTEPEGESVSEAAEETEAAA